MNRRQLIKNILGVSIATIFPIAMQKKELARNRTLHFVGLGGAGCNVVELAMQKYPNANYTFINNSTRNNIPSRVNFVDIADYTKHTKYKGFSFSNEEFLNMKSVTSIFKNKEELYILFVGLGGQTGSPLCVPLLKYLRKEKIDCFLSANFPFDFEGKIRSQIANYTKNELKYFPNVHCIDADTIRIEFGNIQISKAFDKLSERLIENGMSAVNV